MSNERCHFPCYRCRRGPLGGTRAMNVVTTSKQFAARNGHWTFPLPCSARTNGLKFPSELFAPGTVRPRSCSNDPAAPVSPLDRGPSPFNQSENKFLSFFRDNSRVPRPLRQMDLRRDSNPSLVITAIVQSHQRHPPQRNIANRASPGRETEDARRVTFPRDGFALLASLTGRPALARTLLRSIKIGIFSEDAVTIRAIVRVIAFGGLSLDEPNGRTRRNGESRRRFLRLSLTRELARCAAPPCVFCLNIRVDFFPRAFRRTGDVCAMSFNDAVNCPEVKYKRARTRTSNVPESSWELARRRTDARLHNAFYVYGKLIPRP